MEIIITDYARLRMNEREIEKEMVIKTLNSPEVIQPAHTGRYAVAKFFPYFKNGKYVVVIYEIENNTLIVINTFPRDVKKVKKLQKRIGGGDEKK